MSISNISFFNGLGRDVKYVHADKFDLYVRNRYRIADVTNWDLMLTALNLTDGIAMLTMVHSMD